MAGPSIKSLIWINGQWVISFQSSSSLNSFFSFTSSFSLFILFNQMEGGARLLSWRCSRRQTKSKDDETKREWCALLEWNSAAVDGRCALITHNKEQLNPHRNKTFNFHSISIEFICLLGCSALLLRQTKEFNLISLHSLNFFFCFMEWNKRYYNSTWLYQSLLLSALFYGYIFLFHSKIK